MSTKIGDVQEISLNISCAVSNLIVLHSAMTEMDFRGPALCDAINFVVNSLKNYCDQLDICINDLIKEEYAHKR